MPSERMDSNGLSSSFFLEHVNFPNERQVGFWKSGITPADYGVKLDGASSMVANNSSISSSSPLEGRPQIHSFGKNDPRLIHSPKVGHCFEKPAVGSERAAMMKHLDLNSGTRSNFKGEGNHMLGVQYETGQFSSSLSELFDRQCNFRSPQVNASCEEMEPFESLEEIEAQTIGNLLPDDDDFLNGLTDYPSQRNGGDDSEDLDFFSSVGGMDLGDDKFHLGKNDSEFTVVSDHSYVRSPSRTLFVRNISSNIEDSELHALFEQYGDIRALYTACKYKGFIMISYYDIRAAKNAMKALQNQPLRNKLLDVHFYLPKDNSSEEDINQGIVMVSNLDSSVSNEDIRRIFCAYGEIKEVSESPHPGQQKIIQFYDVRDAETALHALKKSEIARNLIKLSNPANISFIHGGVASSSSIDNGALSGSRSSIQSPYSQFMDSAFRHGVSSSVPRSLLKVDSVSSRRNLPNKSIPSMEHHMKFDFQNFHAHSLPEYHDGFTDSTPCNSQSMSAADINIRSSERIENLNFSRLSSNPHSIEMNDPVFSSSANGGSPYIWNNNSPQTQGGVMWSNTSPFVNGTHAARPPWLHALQRAPHMMMSSVMPINNHHHVGSAPSASGFNPGSIGNMTSASGFNPGSIGNMRIMSAKSPHHLQLASQNMFTHVGGNSIDSSGLNSHLHHHQPHRCFMFPGRVSPQMVPLASSFESPNERIRSRRNEGSSNQIDSKKLFDLDIDRILKGEDNRTTLMIKNIPNKYTSKMLLAAIDERHRGTYDFLYLPIDFKNKCNVGYAFINMTDPSLIIPFYQAFNGKKWEKFNSEKVASLAYGRIQGKSALIAHFQNSSLMNEDKRCRPILFNTDGPNAGDQVPFPMGVNIRSRPTKSKTGSSEENNQEGTENSSNEQDIFNTEL